MKAFFTLWGIFAFLAPATLCGIAKDHITACPLKKGEVFVAFTYWTYGSQTFWNGKGQKRRAYNDFEQVEYNLYAEYGVTCRDTILVKSAWTQIDESINGRSFGFEDLRIGWKHYLGIKWSHIHSLEIVGIIPVERVYKPALRYGVYGGEINWLLTRGFSLFKKCGNYDLRIGYRAYCGFPSDQILADGVFNLFVFSKFRLSWGMHLEYGVFNGRSKDDESFFLLNPNYRLLRSQFQGTYCINRSSSLYIGYQRHIWGRNVGTNGGIYAGAKVQF